jgi:hypothetical protein
MRKGKWLCLVMAMALLLMFGCKAPQPPKETEDPDQETGETIDSSVGVGDNTFTDDDFVDDGGDADGQPDTDPDNTDPDNADPDDADPDDTNSEDTIPDHTDPKPAPDDTDPPEQGDTDQPTPEEELAAQYEWYESLSPDEQVSYFWTFETMADFVNWFNAAKAEYDKLHPPIEGGDGEIDFGEIAGK